MSQDRPSCCRLDEAFEQFRSVSEYLTNHRVRFSSHIFLTPLITFLTLLPQRPIVNRSVQEPMSITAANVNYCSQCELLQPINFFPQAILGVPEAGTIGDGRAASSFTG